MKCVSPVCCCWRASFLSRARCLFSSMRLRCSSVRDGAAGEVEGAGEGGGGAAGAGVEWTGAGRSFGKTVLLNGSGSPKTCDSGAAAASSTKPKQWVTESWIYSQFEPCSLSNEYNFTCQGSVSQRNKQWWENIFIVMSYRCPCSPRVSAACPVGSVSDTSADRKRQKSYKHFAVQVCFIKHSDKLPRPTWTSFFLPSFSTLSINSSNCSFGYSLWAQFSILCISRCRSSAWSDKTHKHPEMRMIWWSTVNMNSSTVTCHLSALTSCPLPLKRTSSNSVRRAGSPLSEVSLERKKNNHGGRCLDPFLNPVLYESGEVWSTCLSPVWAAASSLLSF